MVLPSHRPVEQHSALKPVGCGRPRRILSMGQATFADNALQHQRERRILSSRIQSTRQRYYLQSREHSPMPFDLSPLKNMHFPKRQKHVPRGDWRSGYSPMAAVPPESIPDGSDGRPGKSRV